MKSLTPLQENNLSVDVATRLRQLRKDAGLSMRTLATRSGLSANALSVIERGKSSPSVNTLSKIADALGVPITDFFTQPTTLEKVVFVKAGERKHIPFQRGSGETLGGDQFSGRMKPFLITVETGANNPRGAINSGDEFIYCLNGNLEFQVEKDVYDLKAGDSLLFRAELPHSWRAKGSTATSHLLIICE